MFDEIAQKYIDTFGIHPPFPFGIEDEYMVEVMTKAIENGKPIPDDFDWYSRLPDDAVA